MNFEKIAPYLQEPLVLVGFVLFLGFLVSRQLLMSGIIPPLPSRPAFRILRLLLSYGFVLALAIVLLGFGLKYRELSRAEQRAAVALIVEELLANGSVLAELRKNADTLTNAATVFAGVLRDPRFVILHGLFPAENIDPLREESSLTNLYNARIDWLEASNLMNDGAQKGRLTAACAALDRSYERTISTVRSLSDEKMQRYRVSRAAWDAELPIARKITVVDIAGLSSLYDKMLRARATYSRIASIVPEYMNNIDVFCRSLPPSRETLSAALASERLTFRLLPAYRDQLDELIAETKASAVKLSAA
jgi:hypothetical protein